MFQANIVPGQGFVKLFICKGATENVGGRITTTFEQTDQWFWGMITSAPQKEVELWKQLDHPIDHVIVSHDAVTRAKAANYLVTEDERKFYVQGIKNPAGLGISIAYYAEERADL